MSDPKSPVTDDSWALEVLKSKLRTTRKKLRRAMKLALEYRQRLTALELESEVRVATAVAEALANQRLTLVAAAHRAAYRRGMRGLHLDAFGRVLRQEIERGEAEGT